jgi:hypothetical protein
MDPFTLLTPGRSDQEPHSREAEALRVIINIPNLDARGLVFDY